MVASGSPSTNRSVDTSDAEVVRVEDRHLDALAGIIREFWDPTATADAVRRSRAVAARANPAAQGEESPTFLFLSGGRAIGHVGTIPIRLDHEGREHPAHWVKGLMVLPEYQNGPVGFLLLREATRQLETALAMVVQPAPRRLFEGLGYRDLGALPNYLRVLEPARLLRELDLAGLDVDGLPQGSAALLEALRRLRLTGVAGGVLKAASAGWAAVAGGRRSGLRSELSSAIDIAECDGLWHRVADRIGATPVRDGAYLRWRYAGGEADRYQVVSIRDSRDLMAVTVLRRPKEEGDPRLQGLRVATISELVFPPRRRYVGLAALAAAEAAAREMGADALLCSASHPGLVSLLKRRAFLRLPGNVHFMVREPGTTELPTELRDWWLTRGDSNADEVF